MAARVWQNGKQRERRELGLDLGLPLGCRESVAFLTREEERCRGPWHAVLPWPRAEEPGRSETMTILQKPLAHFPPLFSDFSASVN